MSTTRRDALKILGGLAGVAATGAATSGCDPQDPKAPHTPDEPLVAEDAIDTIVVVMMENRTFDHYFGALTLEEGRTDVDGLTADMSNPDADGEPVHPFRLTHGCVEDPPHGWNSSHRTFGDGAMDGFVMEHQDGQTDVSREVMGYHNREDLPVYYALADDNALCDRWFASVMSSTWPNRIYSLTASSEGMQGNDLLRAPFSHPSILSQLTEAGIPWKVYFHDVPFAALLEASGGAFGDNMRPIEEYFVDAAEGRLPPVVFVEPSYVTNDDHPPHAVLLGQAFVGAVYQALAASPQWDTSMMVVDYDEHGGFFDHVAPPTVPDDFADDGFDQLGFRVPALVLGPYARPEVVHTQLEHSSVLSHIQDVFGLDRLNTRNESAAPLWDCLDLDRMAARNPRPPTEIPTLDVSPDDYGAECFYILHPGQEELYDAVDAGVIDRRYDRRAQAAEVTDRVMAQAVKLGVVRLVD